MTNYTLHFTDNTKEPITLGSYYVDGPTSPTNSFPLQHENYPYNSHPSTTLVLYGKGVANYGERVQQNILNILENFASPIAPVFPVQGQLWYDNSISVLHVFTGSGWRNLIDGELGGVINGQLQIMTPPTLSKHATTKEYVDEAILASANVNIGTLTSAYDVNTGNLLIELTPTNYTNVIIPQDNTTTIAGNYDSASDLLSLMLSNNATATVTIPSVDNLSITGSYDPNTDTASVSLSNGHTANITGFQYGINQEIIITDGSNIVSVSTYKPGTNRLWVFMNGIKQTLGDVYDYIEVDEVTISFNIAPPAGNKLELLYL